MKISNGAAKGLWGLIVRLEHQAKAKQYLAVWFQGVRLAHNSITTTKKQET
jgi:hypothetical protein